MVFAGCAVTRNIMSRARLAAIDLYAWPTSLPVNLHITDGPEKDRWAAELDLDPTPKEGQPAGRAHQRINSHLNFFVHVKAGPFLETISKKLNKLNEPMTLEAFGVTENETNSQPVKKQ